MANTGRIGLGGLGYGVAIFGDKELVRNLDRLSEGIQRRIIAKAVRKGGEPILTASEQYAQRSRRTGLLIKSLGMKVGKRKTDKAVYAVIGPRRGFKKQIGVTKSGKPKYADPVRYAHLVEGGTSHSAAKPFLRPALATQRGRALDAIADEVWRGVIAELGGVRP